MKLCAFDLFRTEEVYTKIFNFKETDSYSDSFDAASFSGSNFIIGIGTLFIFVVLFPIFILIHTICRKSFKGNQRYKFLNSFLEQKFFFVIFMIFILEGCLEIGMTCSICDLMLTEENFSSFAEVLSTCLSLFFTLVLAVTPIWSFVVGCLFHRAQKRKDMKTVEKYLPMFEGKKL